MVKFIFFNSYWPAYLFDQRNNMKYFELDQQEKKILNDFDNNDFFNVKELKSAKLKYQDYAKASLNKAKNVNIKIIRERFAKNKS